MIWIYIDSKDTERIATMSTEILWLVLPTLPFFLVIPFMLKRGLSFPISMVAACTITVALYLLTIAVQRR